MELLYIMHVGWGWAKQRPHFLAEELGKHFSITVLFPKTIPGKNMTGETIPFRSRCIFMLPFDHFSLIRRLNAWILLLQFHRHVNRADIIWVTFPSFYRSLKHLSSISNKILVYDAMDNVLAFPKIRNNIHYVNELRRIEEELIRRASVVFCSAMALKSLLLDRYSVEDKIHVVNNAIHLYPSSETHDRTISGFRSVASRGRTLTYFGTIAAWFDFKLVESALDEYPDLHCCLFGPAECAIPGHERIHYFGTVNHSQVYGIMNESDILVMPFEVNELVSTVNPVKLYEYIYSGKPAIAVKYPETEAFSDFVHLYSNKDEFIRLLKDPVPKKGLRESREFVSQNTWESRNKLIMEHLNKIISDSGRKNNVSVKQAN